MKKLFINQIFVAVIAAFVWMALIAIVSSCEKAELTKLKIVNMDCKPHTISITMPMHSFYIDTLHQDEIPPYTGRDYTLAQGEYQLIVGTVYSYPNNSPHFTTQDEYILFKKYSITVWHGRSNTFRIE